MLEHRVHIGRRFRDDLKNVPVFHNLSILIERKASMPAQSSSPDHSLVTVKHDEFSFRHRALEVHPLAGIFNVCTRLQSSLRDVVEGELFGGIYI